ncbi:MAG: hypothetical protein ACRD15_23295 [Vicinamibacterales bacterium]
MMSRVGMSDPLLSRTRHLAEHFLSTVDARLVFPEASFDHLVAAFGHPLQDEPLDPITVIEQLAAVADPGLVASPGPRAGR